MSAKGEQGASAVEFALIVTVLMLILFGTIQFGVAYNRYQGLHASAREGARIGALPDSTVDGIRARVFNSLSIVSSSAFVPAYTCPGSLATEQGCVEVYRQGSPSNVLVTSGSDKPCEPTNMVGKDVIVTVKYKMKISIPLWASPDLTVTTDGRFKCEK